MPGSAHAIRRENGTTGGDSEKRFVPYPRDTRRHIPSVTLKKSPSKMTYTYSNKNYSTRRADLSLRTIQHVFDVNRTARTSHVLGRREKSNFFRKRFFENKNEAIRRFDLLPSLPGRTRRNFLVSHVPRGRARKLTASGRPEDRH